MTLRSSLLPLAFLAATPMATANTSPSPNGEGDGVVVADTCPLVRIVPERLPDLTMPRTGHGIFFAANGELTLVGGHTTNFVPTPTAEYYADGAWHQLPTAYSHDDGFAVALRSGEVLFGGGHTEPLGVGQSYVLERYIPSTHTFEGFGCLDRRRVLANATQLSDGRVVIAGNHYADDAIAFYDGRPQVQDMKPVAQGRSNPYILPIAADDAIILSGNDVCDQHPDTVWVDRLHGNAFRVPLLEHWRLVYTDQPFHSEASFIGDEQRGDYSYLLSAIDSTGQMGIIVVRDTTFSLLPTVCPIPMQSPWEKINYKGPVVVDRVRQKGYIIAIDSLFNRQYVLSIDYAKQPAALTLHHTDPLESPTVAIPILTPDGDLILAGGILTDNYKPLAYVRLYHFGSDDKSSPTSWTAWMWVLMSIVAAIVCAYIIIYAFRRQHSTTIVAVDNPRKPNELPADGIQPSDNVHPSQDSQPADDDQPSRDKLAITDEELMQRICQLLEQEQLFLQSHLRQSDVAAALNVTTARITSCIANCRNLTFIQLIGEYRVRHAKQLISNYPDKKIAAVINESGFTSESTFFRTFKAVTGLSPKEWQAQAAEYKDDK